MYRLLSLILLVTLTALLGGCGLSEEDKDFYYRGWLKPTDLDRPAPKRLGPKHPEPGPGMPRDPLID
jgi:hypothetical protein